MVLFIVIVHLGDISPSGILFDIFMIWLYCWCLSSPFCQECKSTEKGATYYEFRRNSRSVNPTILHFQVSTLGYLWIEISSIQCCTFLLVFSCFVHMLYGAWTILIEERSEMLTRNVAVGKLRKLVIFLLQVLTLRCLNYLKFSWGIWYGLRRNMMSTSCHIFLLYTGPP